MMQNYEIDLSILRPYASGLKWLAFNLLALLIFFYFLQPFMPDMFDARFNQAQWQSEETVRDQLRRDLVLARAERDDLQESLPRFNILLEQGIFDAQDRLMAARLIDQLREANGIATTRYDFGPREMREITQDSGTVPVYTTVLDLRLTGRDDHQIRSFLEDMRQHFPGWLELREMELRRAVPRTAEQAEQIYAGLRPDAVEARLRLIWSSLNPDVLLPPETQP